MLLSFTIEIVTFASTPDRSLPNSNGTGNRQWIEGQSPMRSAQDLGNDE